MYRDIISAPERMVVNGREWWTQEFNHWDGTLEAIRLYDDEGNFVCEFESREELKYFLEGVR